MMPSRESKAVNTSGNLNEFERERSSEGKRPKTKLSDPTTKSFKTKKGKKNTKSTNSI